MSHITAPARSHRDAAPVALWGEGKSHGPHVVLATIGAAGAVAWLNVGLVGRLSFFFDLSFVVLCLVAAFAVRPQDFFAVGVLPPLAMLSVVTMLAVVARPAVAGASDSLVQAVVSGLAHHAGGLVAGYGSALAVLAVRQVALRPLGGARSSG